MPHSFWQSAYRYGSPVSSDSGSSRLRSQRLTGLCLLKALLEGMCFRLIHGTIDRMWFLLATELKTSIPHWLRPVACHLDSPQGSSQHGSWLHQNEQKRKWRRGSKCEPVGRQSLIFCSYIKWHIITFAAFYSSEVNVPFSGGRDYTQCEDEDEIFGRHFRSCLLYLCT
jgi:hypothetical protein